jgi:peptidoglycan/xylan/chitin deacetylase (PgdA/CDA1 family)
MGVRSRGRQDVHRRGKHLLPLTLAADDSASSNTYGIRHLILAYHAVSSSWPSDLAIPEQTLRAQLSLLKRRGFVGMTFRDWEQRRARRSLPKRSVVVTFDDGYASTLNAKPILETLGYPATVFPVLRFVEGGEPLCWPGIERWRHSEHAEELQPLTWSQLEQLVTAGWEVGSHTVGHPLLPELPDEELESELHRSRAGIVDRLGSCDTIAYPYGEADERVARAAASAGYTAGCTLTRFHLADEPHLRPRVGLFSSDTGARLRAKLSPVSLTLRRSAMTARLLGGG